MKLVKDNIAYIQLRDLRFLLMLQLLYKKYEEKIMPQELIDEIKKIKSDEIEPSTIVSFDNETIIDYLRNNYSIIDLEAYLDIPYEELCMLIDRKERSKKDTHNRLSKMNIKEVEAYKSSELEYNSEINEYQIYDLKCIKAFKENKIKKFNINTLNLCKK